MEGWREHDAKFQPPPRYVTFDDETFCFDVQDDIDVFVLNALKGSVFYSNHEV